MEHIQFICETCKHFRPYQGGCDAFPDGIPQSIGAPGSHDKPIKSQGNDIVYEPKEN